jgi:acetyl esterase
VAGVALLYPFLDPWADTASRVEFGTGFMLDARDLLWFGECFAGSPADRADPWLVLRHTPAADLAVVAPTLVVTNELDPLRDEAEAFAAQLRATGLDVETERLDGLLHGAYWMTALTAAMITTTGLSRS